MRVLDDHPGRNVEGVLDPRDPTPLYAQVADLIEQQIRTGELAPGRLIPSETMIVQTYGVARGTARRAVAELRARGLVETLPMRGSYVRPAEEWPGQDVSPT